MPKQPETIFSLAVDSSPEERKRILERECGDDKALARQVTALLEAHDSAGSFLTSPPDLQSAQHQLREIVDMPNDDEYPYLSPTNSPNAMGELGGYVVRSVIGRGGMAVVFKAEDPRLERLVALKVLDSRRFSPDTYETSCQRFHLEAKAAATIKSDHVITIHGVSESHSLPFMVMELIEGKTLRDKIKQVGRMSVQEILRVGFQIASGLAAAHQMGVIHRDITPSNILLENGVERVKITDFGIARVRAQDASITQTGLILGTPAFMSPEQATSGCIDGRSDLFSLGSVLYYAMTGVQPFHGDSLPAILHNIANEEPRPLVDLVSNAPTQLTSLITQLIQKEPHRRPKDAQEVAARLSAMLAADQSADPLCTVPYRQQQARPDKFGSHMRLANLLRRDFSQPSQL